MSGFEFDGSIDDFTNALELVRRNYPKEVKKFMQKEGNKLKNATKRKARSSVKKRTGNYEKSIKRGKYYKHSATGADSIRVYTGSPAHHGHLIEEGHNMVTRGGRNVGFVKGYHVFKSAANEFEDRYESDCEGFVDEIADKLE